MNRQADQYITGTGSGSVPHDRSYYDTGAPSSSASYMDTPTQSSQGTASSSSGYDGVTYDPYAAPMTSGRNVRRPDCSRKLVVAGDGGASTPKCCALRCATDWDMCLEAL